MDENPSLLSQFDELRKITNISTQSCLEEFLQFTTYQEECRLKWLEAVRENQMLKKMLDQSKKENITLVQKLSTARKLLDDEKQKKMCALEDKIKIERQLQMVRDLLADDRNKIHDETKEKLRFLNSTIRLSNACDPHLSAIPEFDSTASLLSDLSCSRSEDDVESVLQRNKRNTYKRHRPSTAGKDEVCDKRRRSSLYTQNNNLNAGDRMVTRTTVTLENDGVISAESHIETIPSAMDPPPSAPLRRGSSESSESGLSIENGTAYNMGTPRDTGVLPISSVRVNMRNHSFVTKTVIRPEDCDVCEKRIKFSSSVLRCQNCRSSCHPACKEDLPLPCIEQGSTPISKKNLGVIADYAPSTQPMVPAVVQHCVKEIESRGLNEHGIYRIPGSDKDVRALKEKFMKCRGVPRLTNVDIHVICGFLKDFLRNLKEPLVTHSLWWDFASAAEIRDVEERRVKLYQAISQLPQPNRDTLAFMVLHMLRLAEAKEINKMPINNLATVMGPCIVGYPSDYSVSETYLLTLKIKVILEQFLLIPAEYWSRVMSSPTRNFSTPHTGDLASSRRTPSTRSFKKLFETPHRYE